MRARPDSAALFVDYDGTLAPIVADPGAAAPMPGAPELLGRLAARFGLVAVVSGRPVSFLAAVLGPPSGVGLYGLYGLEELGEDGGPRPAEEAAAFVPVVAQVVARARAEAPPGLLVEPKGLTMTLHWRTAPGTEAWARAFANEATASSGLVVQDGRMALELRPPLPTDKGTVVARLGRGFAAVACFGDDLGDLPAFAALDQLAADGATAVRVAVADAETPPEVTAAADVVVEGPAGALVLLGLLAGEEGLA
ncbi:MAG TPA: trehalose-phosphatase [Acidimicrobiales bacterium]|nr:trehalose-phosphatase [Acidimicrobiales bacterium]